MFLADWTGYLKSLIPFLAKESRRRVVNAFLPVMSFSWFIKKHLGTDSFSSHCMNTLYTNTISIFSFLGKKDDALHSKIIKKITHFQVFFTNQEKDITNKRTLIYLGTKNLVKTGKISFKRSFNFCTKIV